MGFKEITKANVKGKKVLLRACFDVPVRNGKVTDDTRIRTALPTIKWLTENGAAVIIISKMGRPEGKKVRALSLSQVVRPLSDLLGQKVSFVSEVIGKRAEVATRGIKPGEVILLENLRFHKGEEENDTKFAEKLASYADIFVMDDFPNVKNDHAGITGVTKFLPSYAGITFATEIETLTEAFAKPAKPFVAVIAGAKISTKIDVLKSLIKKIDVLVIGGAMANTFLAAEGYDVGKSLFEPDFIDSADDIKREAEDNGVEVILPDDVIVTRKISDGAKGTVKALDEIEKQDIIVDVGPRSVGKFSEPLKFAGTIFWNGPLGMAEYKNFAGGTIGVAKIISESRAKSIIGGGDTVSAVADLNLDFDFVSTGGGATLELLAEEKLPGLLALK
jgi:phosphoglycerate kinase